MFEDEQEQRYFQAFVTDIGSEKSKPFHNSKVWINLILHASQNERCLRLAVAAIGALSKMQVESQGSLVCGVQNRQNQHYQYALARYQTALRGMMEIESERTALIACLLIFYFENLHGRPDLAFIQVLTGLKVLSKVLEPKSTQTGVTGLPSIPSSGSISEDHTRGLSVPAVSVEDDLVDIFIRLELEAVTFGAPSPVSNISRVHKRITLSSFSNLEEARLALDRVAVEALRFIRYGPTPAPTSSHPDADLVDVKGYSIPQPDDNELIARLAAHGLCEAQLWEWFQAFAPLFHDSQISACREDFFTAAFLQINAKTTKIWLAGALIVNKCDYDRFYPDFKEIVDLSRSLIGHHRTAGGSFVGFGIILPLFCAGTMCRDRILRREAISLLRMTGRMEGIWDSSVLASVATWIMMLEEDGIVSEYIPEEARVSLSRARLDFNQRKCYVRVAYGKRPGQEVIERETEMGF